MSLDSGPPGHAAECTLPLDCAEAMPPWRDNPPPVAAVPAQRLRDGGLQLQSARRHAALVLTGRDADRLATLATVLPAKGAQVRCIVCDLADLGVIAAGDQAVRAYPGQAEPLVWQAIALSSAAKVEGGLGGLAKAKQARDLLLAAEKIDPAALAALVWIYGELIVCNPEADWPNASHALCMAIHWSSPC